MSCWPSMQGRPFPKNKSMKPCSVMTVQRMTRPSPSTLKTSAPSCAQPGQGRCCKRYGELATNGKTKTDIPAQCSAAVSLLCGGGCALILVLWWVIFMQLINSGFLLPAVASAQACADARETVAAVTAETFDSNQISDLCRWAVVQDGTVLQTNMTARQLKNRPQRLPWRQRQPGVYAVPVRCQNG